MQLLRACTENTKCHQYFLFFYISTSKSLFYHCIFINSTNFSFFLISFLIFVLVFAFSLPSFHFLFIILGFLCLISEYPTSHWLLRVFNNIPWFKRVTPTCCNPEHQQLWMCVQTLDSVWKCWRASRKMIQIGILSRVFNISSAPEIDGFL